MTPDNDNTPVFDRASIIHDGLGFTGREDHPYRTNQKFSRTEGQWTPVAQQREVSTTQRIEKPWFRDIKPALARHTVSTPEERAEAFLRYRKLKAEEDARMDAARPAEKAPPKRYRGGASPVVKNILRDDKDGAIALLNAVIAPRWNHDGNVFAPIFDSAEEMGSEREVDEEYITERRYGIRPTEKEIKREMEAADWDKENPDACVTWDRNIARVGSLVFNTDPARGNKASGLMTSYAETKSGKLLRPIVDTSKERGSKALTKAETEALAAIERRDNKSYLRLASEWKGRCFANDNCLFPNDHRLNRAREAEKTLAVAWTNTIELGKVPSFLHLPTGVAWQYGRLAGVTYAKDTASTPGTFVELDNAIVLTDRSNVVLEEISYRANYKEIGLALGYSESYADIGGKKAVRVLIQELKEAKAMPNYVADNDNVEARQNIAA